MLTACRLSNHKNYSAKYWQLLASRAWEKHYEELMQSLSMSWRCSDLSQVESEVKKTEAYALSIFFLSAVV